MTDKEGCDHGDDLVLYCRKCRPSHAEMQERIGELEAALTELTTLKEYKDKNGPDIIYQRDKLKAWEVAFNLCPPRQRSALEDK